MNLTDKRTKIIATIGPSSDNLETMRKLFDAGMTTIRMNFSHGDHKEQGAKIKIAADVSKQTGFPLSLMLDTKGPEIRVGNFKDGKQKIIGGAKVTIYTDNASFKNKECLSTELTVSYDMSKDLSVGKVVLIDDGKLQLDVVEVMPGVVKTVAKNTHIVKSNKRVNLPGTKFSMDFLAKKDIDDIRFGCKQGIDFVAASFVNTPEDIKQIRDILKEEDSENVQIYAKIESQYAVDHFEKILNEADGVMIARGDLGLEIPYYEVPVAEKMMIRKCREAGKPVIVATQMLDSMESNPHPTRAEVTDVYLATELGADATMLSGESANGDYPIEAVEVMSTINKRAEKEFFKKLYYEKQLGEISKVSNGKRAKIAKKVAVKASDGSFRFAVVLSRTGQLLHEVSKFRPNLAVLGTTNDEKQITKFGITAGVFMYPEVKAFEDIKNDVNASFDVVRKFGGLPGDKFLVVENKQITEHIL